MLNEGEDFAHSAIPPSSVIQHSTLNIQHSAVDQETLGEGSRRPRYFWHASFVLCSTT
jgi:hypothetical protein